MKIKATSFEILNGIHGTKLLLAVAKESVSNLITANNDNSLSGDLAVEIKKWTNRRSLNANAYFHLLVNKIAEKLKTAESEMKIKLNLEYGTPATDKNGQNVIVKLPKEVDITQFYDYSKWLGNKKEPNGIETSYYLFYKQTHTLDSAEMARLIDGTIQEAKELGIETLTPDEKAKMIALWSNNGK